MPQKPLFTRPPLMDRAQCPLSRGQVRAAAPEMKQLYDKVKACGPISGLLEAAFSVSVLVCEHPEKEPAAREIRNQLAEWEQEKYPADPEIGIALARAALALYEYTTDRHILSILALWCRKLEAAWDEISCSWWIRIQPADLMDFFVRFYRITGLKAVLRLCARLRTSSMDWTTLLQNDPARLVPETQGHREEIRDLFSRKEIGSLEFSETQYLAHHSELLADALRYTACSAMYSGHEQELKAGRNGWEHLRKNHYAVFGGLAANPFLAGGSASAGIDPASSAAWAEAMIAQMQIHSDAWAVDEATRLVHNAIARMLKNGDPCRALYANIALETAADRAEKDTEGEEIKKLARIARAAALVYQSAVTQTADSVRLNWQLPGRFLLQTNGQAVMLQAEPDRLLVRGKGPARIRLEVFYAATETAGITLKTEGTEKKAAERIPAGHTGVYLIMDREWKPGDALAFIQGERIVAESGHHQSVSFFIRNRLMSYPVKDGEFAFAAAGLPRVVNGEAKLPVRPVRGWKMKDGIPADVPVLPPAEEGETTVTLAPFAETEYQIAVFPGTLDHE